MPESKNNKRKDDKIIIKGARTHNLKNIDLEIPRNKMVVFTGLSGSGKSSLAFDTIFAEGQRRYVESLSAYARQFLNKMQQLQKSTTICVFYLLVSVVLTVWNAGAKFKN
jgi:excinuclease UvrABC ATPase subunit